jgi:DNA-binding response OmpR family regulator
MLEDLTSLLMNGGVVWASIAGSRLHSNRSERLTMGTPHTRVDNSHVLVVDDDRDTADSAAMILASLGFQASPAYDAQTALHIAMAHPPEAVLLDAALPGQNGYLLARELRQLRGMEDALLICVSGYGSDEHFVRSREAGCQYHFLKPVNWEQLVRVLNKGRTLAPAYA